MNQTAKTIISNYDRYFVRKFRYRYWLVIVSNYYLDLTTFYLYSKPINRPLTSSHELGYIPFKNKIDFTATLNALKDHSKLTIEYRDTRTPLHPEPVTVTDNYHGHGSSTTYRPKEG